MNALFQKVRQGTIYRTLPCHARHARKGGRLDFDGEVALTRSGIVAAMTSMFLAVVNDLKLRRTECLSETPRDFGGYRPA